MTHVLAGTVKITPTIAWTTSMLAWGMLEFGSGYDLSGPSAWQTGLQTLRWNTDYLLKTFKLDAQSSAVSEAPEFFIVYQVQLSEQWIHELLLINTASTA